MGIFDSTSTTRNKTTDNRAVGDGEAIVATGRAAITVNQQSREAIEALTSIASQAFTNNRQTFAETVDTIRTSNEQAQAIANRAINQTRSETSQLINAAIPVAIVAAIVWGVSRT